MMKRPTSEGPMRIAFLTPEYTYTPGWGGIATYTRDAANWLVINGHEVHVVVLSRTEEQRSFVDQGVHVHVSPPRRIKPRRVLHYAARLPGLTSLEEAYAGWDRLEDSYGALVALKQLQRTSALDVIEVADCGGLGFWAAGQPNRRVPLVVRSHGYANVLLPGWNWDGIHFQLALERYSIRWADFVLTASVERIENYRMMFGVSPERIGSLPYGIDMGSYPARPKDQDRCLDRVRILYLGRVEQRKGCDVLFEALTQVHSQVAAIQVTFVGPIAADMQHEFNNFLSRSEGWASYVGPVPPDQVVSFLHQSDMIVLPSRFETLPRVLLEALAVGLPQVAAPVNGVPEIVRDGVTGILVDPLTPGVLAAAIERLCFSPELRMAMAQESRARALRKFDIEHVMPMQVAVYRALLERRSPLPVLALQTQ